MSNTYDNGKNSTSHQFISSSRDIDTTSDDNFPERKVALRKSLLTWRRTLTATQKAAADAAICEHVLAWWRTHPVQILGVFHPIRQEPDLHSAYHTLAHAGVHLALPIVRNKEEGLDFIVWQPGTVLADAGLGTLAPTSGEYVKPEALLIPCVGFTATGMRLGYGGGFYDRTLAEKTRPVAVGIAYAHTLVDFPAEEHDIALNTIITEKSGSTIHLLP